LSGADFTGDVTTTGDVGIGTSTPNTPQAVNLHISGTSSAIRMSDTSNSLTGNLYASGGEFSILTSTSHPITFKTANSEAMRIDSSGNVGINESSPLGKLHVKTGESGAGVNASASDLVLEDVTDAGMSIISTGTGNIYFGDVANGSVGRISYSHSNNALSFNTNAAERMRLESDGDLHADGDVIAYSTTISDIRLKDNIVGINNALAKVGQLNGYTFEYKADGKVSAGVIAQEVEAVLPEAVSEKQLPLKADDGQEYKVVNYDALHGLLIEAIKELTERVEALEAK